MIVGTGNFRGGETRIERAGPGSQEAVMELVDGFTAERNHLEPTTGITQQSAGTITSGDLMPGLFDFGTVKRVVMADNLDKLRYVTPGAAEAWTDAVAAISADCDTQAKPVAYSRHIVAPDKVGIREFEPAAAATLPRTQLLSMKGPLDHSATEAPTVALSACAVDMTGNDCDDVSEVTTLDGTVSVAESTAYKRYGTNTLEVTLASSAADTDLFEITTPSTLDMSAKEYILIYAYLHGEGGLDRIVDADYGPEGIMSGLGVCLYTAGGYHEWEFYPPALEAGWNLLICYIPAGIRAAFSSVTKFKFKTDTGWDYAAATKTFYLDHVCFATAAELAAWSEIDPVYDYLDGGMPRFFARSPSTFHYSYAAARKSHRDGDKYHWVNSNPSAEESIAILSGDQAQITASKDGFNNTSYPTDVMFYRRLGTDANRHYIATEAIGSYPDFDVDEICTDEGALGDYDEALSLTQYAQLDHDVGSPARHLLAMDGRIYALCCGYDSELTVWQRKTEIQISSWKKPWYFPTSVGQDSLADSGTVLDNYAVTGTEGRGWGTFQAQKIVFLDNECFLLRGDNWAEGWNFVRLGAIGCKSQCSVADCKDALIWHNGEDFYAYAGGAPVCISRNKIDSSQIDWTEAHDAAYWNGKYILYCKFSTADMLLIYDLETAAWTRRSCPPYVGLVADNDNNVLYGVNSGGYLTKLFDSATTEDFNESGEAESLTLLVNTCYWPVGTPETEAHLLNLVVEATAPGETLYTIDYMVASRGLKDATQSGTIVVTRGFTRYVKKLNIYGYAAQVRLSFSDETDTPPQIHFVGLAPDKIVGRE